MQTVKGFQLHLKVKAGQEQRYQLDVDEPEWETLYLAMDFAERPSMFRTPSHAFGASAGGKNRACGL